jgi:hypothetical protein
MYARWSHSCFGEQAIPQGNLFAVGTGLTARYYNNDEFDGDYVARQVDPNIDFNWGQGTKKERKKKTKQKGRNCGG